MTGHDLPLVNACLNATAAVLLCAGLYFIKRHRPVAHRNCMISAFAVSCVFLVCYLYHKYSVLGGRHTPFPGPPEWKLPYLVLLATHVVLAMAIVPLALMTISRGVKQKVELHKKIARWTLPIWLYVSFTGVLIYVLLYKVWPERG
jgi:uncharacterized membrane protein YozB (DUF420 family)